MDSYHHSDRLVYMCRYHVVFCPKYRRKVLVGEVADRCRQLFLESAAKNGFEILEMEIMPDHVHLLIDCNPSYGIMEGVKRLKYDTTCMRREFPKLKTRIPNLWTKSAFIASVGSVSSDTMKAYIQNQKRS